MSDDDDLDMNAEQYRKPKLWNEYFDLLEQGGHVSTGHDAVDTVNRLNAKSPWAKVSGKPLNVLRVGLEIVEEFWPLTKLWPLLHPEQQTERLPRSPSTGTVLLLRFDGRVYVMDGRRRINSWQRDGANGPHRALVMQRGIETSE